MRDLPRKETVINAKLSENRQYSIMCNRQLIGSQSNDDGNAEDDISSKLNLYFISEIRNFLHLFSTPMFLKRAQVKFALSSYNSKRKNQNIASRRRSRSWTTQKFLISSSL